MTRRLIDYLWMAFGLALGLTGSMIATLGVIGVPVEVSEGGAVAPSRQSAWFGTSPALAPASRRVIEVVDRIAPPAWKVSTAVGWVDRHTGSDMRMVTSCTGTAYRCIVIRAGKVNSSAVGRTKNGVITIDVAKARKGAYAKYYRNNGVRTWLLAHELGHAFGLQHRTGVNLMNPTAGRGALSLTKSQHTHLRSR